MMRRMGVPTGYCGMLSSTVTAGVSVDAERENIISFGLSEPKTQIRSHSFLMMPLPQHNGQMKAF